MRFISSTITPRRRSLPRRPRNAWLAALLALALCLPSAALAAAPNMLRVAMVVPEDLQLYPLRVMDRDAVSLLDLVYNSLIELDDDRMPQPSLAIEWDTGDGKTWKFYLREDVYFHDGREMTAYDVKATMDALKAIADDESIPENEKGPYALFPKMWKNWEVTDKHVLTVRTDRPFFGLLYSMTFPVLQSQTLQDPNPPGTGPYRIASYTPGQEIWLVGNENWWKQPPHVREITGVWFANENDALRAFDAESIDVMMTRATTGVRYRGTASIRTNSYDYSTRQLETLVMNNYNNAKNPLRDLTFRQAVSSAIDKSRLISGVYQGLVVPTDTIQSPQSKLYNEGSAQYGKPYNPEEAKRLLDSLGYNKINDKGYRYKVTDAGETPLKLRLNYYDEYGNTLRKEAANEIAAMLRAVGIDVSVSGLSFATAKERLEKANYDLFLCAYNFDIPPDPNFLLLNVGYGNYAYHRSDDLNKLCEKLRKSYLQEDFRAVWFDIQDYVAQNIPFMPLYWRGGVVLTRYAYSAVRDIREMELLRSVETYE